MSNEQNEGTRTWNPKIPDDMTSHMSHQHQQQRQAQQAMPEIFNRGSVSNNIPNHYSATNLGHISENYSVLAVGEDCFLKVYHNTENEQQPLFNSYELFSSNSILPPHNVLQMDSSNKHQFQNTDTTNMIINQLVTNWSPNLSGTYSPFGEQNNLSQQQSQQNQSIHFDDQQFLLMNKMQQPNQQTENINSPSIMSCEKTEFNENNVNPGISSFKNQPKNINLKSSKTNGSLENQYNVPEIKKRIVAEVKPMRMSYSDVLSKNVEINKISSSAHVNSSVGSLNPPNGDFGSNQVRNSNKYPEKSKTISSGYNTPPVERKQQLILDEKEKLDTNKNKKYDNGNSHKFDENFCTSSSSKEKRKSNSAQCEEIKEGNKKYVNNKDKKSNSSNEKAKQKTSVNNSDNSKKRFNRKLNDPQYDEEGNQGKNNFKEYFYNVTVKTTEGNLEKSQKYPQNLNNKKSRNSQKLSNSFGNNNAPNMFRSDKNSYSKRNQKQRKDMKKEMIIKFIEKWLEYTMKILTWLFYLVYDVVVLSFGIAYDRMKIGYYGTLAYLYNLQKELKQNSGKPSEWIKNLFMKFDCKFSKNSKLAFWRRFNKKPEENHTEFYKNGRLPQTGDEAMYSLLNCKGKDAYSILGVTPESSQEQIRKHYKKIAVLVHPDKNKQPGAEEAFKVLQRAFELIGEPENRKSYDQSLAEALHAEKAWSELHDLLSQLQSKIAEAANTIRCSSCGLRHPRKLTDRPHYAARECSSCKIRHSAREGDIWAETSFFGLRWKYLALMDGKCYDITEWANCQKGALSHLKPNSHVVQYRIVRGGQQQHQQQQNVNFEKEKVKREPPSEPSLDDFLDNLYSGQNPQNQQQQQQNSSRRRSRKN